MGRSSTGNGCIVAAEVAQAVPLVADRSSRIRRKSQLLGFLPPPRSVMEEGSPPSSF